MLYISYDGSVPAPKNELNEAIARYTDNAHTTAAQIGIRTVVAGIPYAGSAILELIDGLAQRRTQERLNIVFASMKDCLDRLDEEKIDRAFFDSEEFQSILFLLIEKLHTTHDEERLRTFGTALANSAKTEFDRDEREDFIRTLRELSSKDLKVLQYARSRGFFSSVAEVASLGRLVGMGLINDRLKKKGTPLIPIGSDSRRVAQALEEFVTHPPERTYSISSFGIRFLAFITAKSDLT